MMRFLSKYSQESPRSHRNERGYRQRYKKQEHPDTADNVHLVRALAIELQDYTFEIIELQPMVHINSVTKCSKDFLTSVSEHLQPLNEKMINELFCHLLSQRHVMNILIIQ